MCILVAICPYFNDNMYGMPEELKEQYCRGEYLWCGRYLIYVAVERERQIRFGGSVKDEA